MRYTLTGPDTACPVDVTKTPAPAVSVAPRAPVTVPPCVASSGRAAPSGTRTASRRLDTSADTAARSAFCVYPVSVNVATTPEPAATLPSVYVPSAAVVVESEPVATCTPAIAWPFTSVTTPATDPSPVDVVASGVPPFWAGDAPARRRRLQK